MKTVLPVAVQFLKQENQEICRNMSSYLALAAIDNASLLALHCDDITESIISGEFHCSSSSSSSSSFLVQPS